MGEVVGDIGVVSEKEMVVVCSEEGISADEGIVVVMIVDCSGVNGVVVGISSKDCC